MPEGAIGWEGEMEVTSGGTEESTGTPETVEVLPTGLKTLIGPATRTPASSHPRHGCILVAGDDAELSSTVDQFAGRLGMGAVIARDFDAFQTANESEPEIILLNLRVGDHDAVEVLRYLSERRSRAYIVLVGDADVKVVESAERLGRSRRLSMQPSLQKPVSVAALRAVLKTTLDARPEITAEELREGIDRKRFVPFFQPVIDLAGRENGIVRAEVLARWDHPFHGMLTAAEFIEAAEKHGVIAELTASLLAQALTQAGACREGGLMLPISINISATSLTDLSLPDTLSEIVAERGFRNEMVMIELTESSMTEDRLEILDVLTRLRMKGFGLAMDDFGTGYSTLLELVRLPFNEIKIDQRFVEKLEIRRESDIVIGSTVGLAHGLGMTVCAEGVESRKSLEFLRRAGCDAAQGRYIQEPVSGEDLMACLRNWYRTDARQSGFPAVVRRAGGSRWGPREPGSQDPSLL